MLSAIVSDGGGTSTMLQIFTLILIVVNVSIDGSHLSLETVDVGGKDSKKGE